jgi:hypothetical protein
MLSHCGKNPSYKRPGHSSGRIGMHVKFSSLLSITFTFCTLILTFFVFNIGSNSSYPRNLSPSVLEHSDTALLTLPCHKANRSSWELLGSQFPNVRTPARFSEIVRSNSKVHMTFCIQYNLRFVLNIDVLLIK